MGPLCGPKSRSSDSTAPVFNSLWPPRPANECKEPAHKQCLAQRQRETGIHFVAPLEAAEPTGRKQKEARKISLSSLHLVGAKRWPEKGPLSALLKPEHNFRALEVKLVGLERKSCPSAALVRFSWAAQFSWFPSWFPSWFAWSPVGLSLAALAFAWPSLAERKPARLK